MANCYWLKFPDFELTQISRFPIESNFQISNGLNLSNYYWLKFPDFKLTQTIDQSDENWKIIETEEDWIIIEKEENYWIVENWIIATATSFGLSSPAKLSLSPFAPIQIQPFGNVRLCPKIQKKLVHKFGPKNPLICFTSNSTLLKKVKTWKMVEDSMAFSLLCCISNSMLKNTAPYTKNSTFTQIQF